jgi:putative membrane protein
MLVKRKMPGCLGLVVMWLASAAAVWLTAELLPGVQVAGFGAALGVAVVLGLLNALVRPVLVILTFPVTVLTLGLFLLVINAAVVGLAAWLLAGFAVDDFLSALLAAVVLSVLSTLLGWLLPEKRPAAKEQG